jgi:phosphoenolpyruvate carboxykinase (GTP)
VSRRDPMAMIPFCGYNMAEYFGHWLKMGRKIAHPPKVFHVNWFRRGADGKFLWPGYGENVRVLKWMQERIAGTAKAMETPIGFVPAPDALTLDGLKIDKATVSELLRVQPADWAEEMHATRAFFEKFSTDLPAELWHEHQQLGRRLDGVAATKK